MGFLAAAVLGLFGLPVLFGGLPDPAQATVWLGLGVADCVIIALLAALLAGHAASALMHVPARGIEQQSMRRMTANVARSGLAAISLVIIQAILRRPLVAVFGASTEPFLVEAAVSGFALILLLAILVFLHGVAAGLIEGVAWSALDSALVTSGSEKTPRRAAAASELEAPNTQSPAPVPTDLASSEQHA